MQHMMAEMAAKAKRVPDYTEVREAVVVMESFAGITRHACVVVGETAKKYRVKMKERTRLPRHRWVYAGEPTLVPKHAVEFV